MPDFLVPETATNEDIFYLKAVLKASEASDDPDTQTGCVIVSPSGNIISSGANKFIDACYADDPIWTTRPYKYAAIGHAEVDALKKELPTVVDRIYINWLPCVPCARAIVPHNPRQVVIDYTFMEHYYRLRNVSQWHDDFLVVVELFKKKGIQLRAVESDVFLSCFEKA